MRLRSLLGRTILTGKVRQQHLCTLINVDIQPHVITRKLNVLAGRLYAEHGILFRSERVHEGRKLRLWKDNTENV